MWPFKSKPEPEDTTSRLERLEKRMKSLEEDWTETYGKFRTLQMRVAKQVQRLDQSPAHQEDQAGEGETTGTSVATSLSPRAALIQQQILQRRKAMNGGS
jgi:hypothetical protein